MRFWPAMTRRVASCLALLVWQFGAVCDWAFTVSAGQSQRQVCLTARRVRERRQTSPWPRLKQAGSSKDGHAAAKVITSRVQKAASASDVLAVMQAEHHNPNMDLFAVAAAWIRLAKLQRTDVSRHSHLLVFVQLTESLLKDSSGQSRQVANIFWAAARLQALMPTQLANLWKTLATAILQTVKDMNSQDIANVVWGIGQLLVDPNYSAKHELQKLLPSLVAQAAVVVPEANPQDLANSCRGLALSQHYDASYLEAVADKVANAAAGWRPQGAQKDLPEVLFAFARLKAEGHGDMLDVSASKLTPILAMINDWGLCVTAWSYQQLDTAGHFLEFRQRLEAEVMRRGFSEDDIERSRSGPEAW